MKLQPSEKIGAFQYSKDAFISAAVHTRLHAQMELVFIDGK